MSGLFKARNQVALVGFAHSKATRKPGRPLGVSVGVALSGPNDDAAALMARSDVAMYRAKQGGKGRAALAEPNKEDSDAGAPV